MFDSRAIGDGGCGYWKSGETEPSITGTGRSFPVWCEWLQSDCTRRGPDKDHNYKRSSCPMSHVPADGNGGQGTGSPAIGLLEAKLHKKPLAHALPVDLLSLAPLTSSIEP
jgi:hypothetical protein